MSPLGLYGLRTQSFLEDAINTYRIYQDVSAIGRTVAKGQRRPSSRFVRFPQKRKGVDKSGT